MKKKTFVKPTFRKYPMMVETSILAGSGTVTPPTSAGTEQLTNQTFTW